MLKLLTRPVQRIAFESYNRQGVLASSVEAIQPSVSLSYVCLTCGVCVCPYQELFCMFSAAGCVDDVYKDAILRVYTRSGKKACLPYNTHTHILWAMT